MSCPFQTGFVHATIKTTSPDLETFFQKPQVLSVILFVQSKVLANTVSSLPLCTRLRQAGGAGSGSYQHSRTSSQRRQKPVLFTSTSSSCGQCHRGGGRSQSHQELTAGDSCLRRPCPLTEGLAASHVRQVSWARGSLQAWAEVSGRPGHASWAVSGKKISRHRCTVS